MPQRIIAGTIVLSCILAGASTAKASEITGTLSSSSGDSSSASGGTLVATVSDGSSPAGGGESSLSSGGGGGGGLSGSRRALRTQNGPVVLVGEAPVESGSSLGVGGGFDPDAERAIASLGDGSDNELSPSDAVAFNNSRNPLANTDLVAATGDNRGLGSAKVWTAVVLGLALLGLAGYAVNALMAYRRENDL